MNQRAKTESCYYPIFYKVIQSSKGNNNTIYREFVETFHLIYFFVWTISENNAIKRAS